MLEKQTGCDPSRQRKHAHLRLAPSDEDHDARARLPVFVPHIIVVVPVRHTLTFRHSCDYEARPVPVQGMGHDDDIAPA